MRADVAVALFQGNWFARGEEKLALTEAERDFISAALGPEPKRWQGTPDVGRMEEILAAKGDVLARIGERLVRVVVGMRGCGGAVTFLLQQGVPLRIDTTAYNVLHEAAWAGSADTLRAVFEAGAADATCVSVRKPHVGWPDNLSLMYWAAWGGYPEVAQLLIRHGVGAHHERKIKGNGERGTTSLHEALAPSAWGRDAKRRQGKREVAQLLIADGAVCDIYSTCALDDAKRLRALLEANPDALNAAEDFGMTPLHWAARAGAMRCVELLLRRGADPNPVNASRRVPLHLAAEVDGGEQGAVIALLASHGADVNAQDRKGRTPLHRATYEGRVAAAEALLEAGADPAVPNKRGKTAFEIARKDAKYFKARALPAGSRGT